MFRTILPPRPARPTVGGSPRQVFRVILDEEGSIEEVVDLLSDYRPHLIALCSRPDSPLRERSLKSRSRRETSCPKVSR